VNSIAVTVTPNGNEIQVLCQAKDPKDKDCGVLTGRLSQGVMSASGKIFDEAATWKAQRPPALERTATRHEFVPTLYHNQFSGLIEPALDIKPGDTVHTTTVDAGGVDSNGAHVAAGGNPRPDRFTLRVPGRVTRWWSS
jgi:amidase